MTFADPDFRPVYFLTRGCHGIAIIEIESENGLIRLLLELLTEDDGIWHRSSHEFQFDVFWLSFLQDLLKSAQTFIDIHYTQHDWYWKRKI